MTRSSHRKPVTQSDVAFAVGCSQNTVALALRDSPRISAPRRRAILKAAAKLGYRPNAAARALRRGRSNLVGVFTGVLDYIRLHYVRRIMSELQSTPFKPLLGLDQASTLPWFNAPWVSTLRDLQVEAMISFAWHDRASLPPWHRETPIIFSGIQPEDPQPCDCIAMDRAAAAQMATEHLLTRGHRRIEMIAPYRNVLLLRGYRTAMLAMGHKPSLSLIGGDSPHPTPAAYIQSIRKRRDRPTALFVLASPLAADLVNAALAAGMKVPGDLAVVGYDAIQWADKLAVPLTTIEQPIEKLVIETIKAVRRRVDSRSAPHLRITLPFELCVRASS